MNKGEEKAVGKANGTSAADLLDLPLIHILTVLLGLQLDTRHIRVHNILYANKCNTWSEFRSKDIEEILKYEYEDTKSGTIVKFNKFYCSQFQMIEEFRN